MILADRRGVLKGTLASASALSTWTISTLAGASPTSLASLSPELVPLFRDPPPGARPAIYWYWMYGNVTREGITADLEGFARAGIGTVVLFSILGQGENTLIKPAANALTPYWWGLVDYSAEECDRLGLELALNVCDGWATAGGPWITPELSMQMLVWSETALDGGRAFAGRLQQPESLHDYYRDLRVVAFPRPVEWDQTSVTRKVIVTGSIPIKNAARLLDPANSRLEIDTGNAGDIVFAFVEPFVLRSITLSELPHKKDVAGIQRAMNSLVVEASDDGHAYRLVTTLDYPRNGWETDVTTLTHPIPETRARFFRLVYEPSDTGPLRQDLMYADQDKLQVASILLSGRPAIQGLPFKTSQQWGKSPRTTAAELPDAACIDPSSIIDLTTSLKSSGRLDWTPPPGRWTVLRIGCTTTGLENGPGGAGVGLECDKLSKHAAQIQFAHWFNEALNRTGRGKALRLFHVDSWEARSQNWSPGLPEEFRRLRGYDLKTILPILAGVPLASADHCERMLYDFRRTLAELTSTNFFGEMSSLAHANGCKFEAEVPNPTYPVDGLDYGRSVDIPMGEFWLRTPVNYKPQDIREAVSAAHVYGRTVAGSEAFTELSIKWDETPRMLKPLGDHHFAQGINRFYLHVSAMQPWTDRVPGMTLMGVGTFFGRNQSWWPLADAWISYLIRSQALLQQGTPVVDVAMFIGEDIPARAFLPEDLPVALPPGLQYDSINRDVLLNSSRVEAGRLILDCGMSYAVLFLPKDRLMSPQLAERLAGFAEQGLAIVGMAPAGSPGGQDAAIDDARVRAAAGRMAPFDLSDTAALARLLQSRGTIPDLLADVPDIEWAHRQGDGWDLYFVSNQADEPRSAAISIRVNGGVHSLDARNGRMVPLAAAEADGRSTFTLDLEPHGSRLLLVLPPRPSDIVALTGSGGDVSFDEDAAGTTGLVQGPGQWLVKHRSGEIRRFAADAAPSLPVTGTWRVSFGNGIPDARLLKLISWTLLSDERQQFFSGIATYWLDLSLDGALLSPLLEWFLDLGDVRELARIRLNDRAIATLWTPPFEVNVTRFLQPGVNRLQIEVANCWKNRLVGDSAKPEHERSTFVWPPIAATGPNWLPTPSDDLLPSGLLGPVRLRSAIKVRV